MRAVRASHAMGYTLRTALRSVHASLALVPGTWGAHAALVQRMAHKREQGQEGGGQTAVWVWVWVWSAGSGAGGQLASSARSRNWPQSSA